MFPAWPGTGGIPIASMSALSSSQNTMQCIYTYIYTDAFGFVWFPSGCCFIYRARTRLKNRWRFPFLSIPVFAGLAGSNFHWLVFLDFMNCAVSCVDQPVYPILVSSCFGRCPLFRLCFSFHFPFLILHASPTRAYTDVEWWIIQLPLLTGA